MKTWNFGIIGCGSIADSHIQAIRDIDHATIAAVSSRTERRARNIAEQENCDWTVDYNKLLSREDIDIVCVTTSSGSHAQIGEDVIKAGKHLLIEKPIAMKAKEADKLISLAKEYGVSLSVVSQNRFKEHIEATKQVLDQGKLGRVTLIEVFAPFYRDQKYYDQADWRGTLTEDGGALMNQGIHFIDIMLWLGGHVKTVIGKTATMLHEMEAEDLGLAIVQFEKGAFGTIMSSTNCKPGYPQSIHIYGEKGCVKLNSKEILEWSVEDTSEPENRKSSTTSHGGSNPRDIAHVYHKKQMIDFMHAIEHQNTPVVTGEDGRNAVQLIESIYASNQSKREVSL